MQSNLIQYKIFPEQNAVVAWLCGDVAFEHMNHYLYTLSADPDFVIGMNSYCDLSYCSDMDGGLGVANDFADRLNNEKYVVAPSRSAILLPDSNAKVVRIIEGLVLMMSGSPIEHACFSIGHIERAFDFLGFDSLLRSNVVALSRDIAKKRGEKAASSELKAVAYSSN